jgi:CheY-like chemotaxis protein
MDSDQRSHVHSVLVVADHPVVRDACATMLRFEAIDVVTAWGAPAALAALEAGARPCVAFIDLEPIDAVALARRMQTEAVTVPLVLLVDGRGRARTSAFSGVVKQPVDTDILRAAVEKYCLMAQT